MSDLDQPCKYLLLYKRF